MRNKKKLLNEFGFDDIWATLRHVLRRNGHESLSKQLQPGKYKLVHHLDVGNKIGMCLSLLKDSDYDIYKMADGKGIYIINKKNFTETLFYVNSIGQTVYHGIINNHHKGDQLLAGGYGLKVDQGKVTKSPFDGAPSIVHVRFDDHAWYIFTDKI